MTNLDVDRITGKYKSTTHYILNALIPYTEPNLKLVFVPKYFFRDLAKLDKHKQLSLKNAYYNCIRQGYIELDEITRQPIITEHGLSKIKEYKPVLLTNSEVLVIFDIPEDERWKRRQFRTLLVQLKFSQVQKSVWTSKYDSRQYLKLELKRQNLSKYVKIFEAKEIE